MYGCTRMYLFCCIHISIVYNHMFKLLSVYVLIVFLALVILCFEVYSFVMYRCIPDILFVLEVIVLFCDVLCCSMMMFVHTMIVCCWHCCTNLYDHVTTNGTIGNLLISPIIESGFSKHMLQCIDTSVSIIFFISTHVFTRL